jgi:hypothetical protein
MTPLTFPNSRRNLSTPVVDLVSIKDLLKFENFTITFAYINKVHFFFFALAGDDANRILEKG